MKDFSLDYRLRRKPDKFILRPKYYILNEGYRNIEIRILFQVFQKGALDYTDDVV